MTRSHWLAVVALLAMCVALAAVRAAHADPGQVRDVAWYLKGEGDAIFSAQNQGMKIVRLTCVTAASGIACQLVVSQASGGYVCSHGVFTVKGFAVNGQFSVPKRCHRGAGPPS